MATEIVPVSVGTDAPQQTPSDAASRPSGVAESIFAKIQKAQAEGPKKTEDAPLVATKSTEIAPPPTTDQVLADAGKAPATPAVAPAPVKPPSMRAMIKASNIPAEAKDELANGYYLGRAAHESGLTPDTVQLFKAQGVTPASISERLQLHPTIDDAKRDSWYAGEMRRIAFDYNKNPNQFLIGLKASSTNTPDVYKNLIVLAAKQHKDVDHASWLDGMTDALRNALDNLGREAAAQKNEDLQTAVGMVKQSFGMAEGIAPAAPAVDPRTAALEKENAELHARQRAADDQGRTAFLESVVTEARNAVYRHVAAKWQEAAPAGLDAPETKRAIDDVFYGVENDLKGVSNFVYDLAARRNGPQTQQAYRDAVQYAFDRALPFVPIHLKSALDFWTKHVSTTAAAIEATEKKAASQTDAAAVPGGTSAPGPGKTQKEVMAELKAKGLSFKEIIATMSNMALAKR